MHVPGGRLCPAARASFASQVLTLGRIPILQSFALYDFMYEDLPVLKVQVGRHATALGVWGSGGWGVAWDDAWCVVAAQHKNFHRRVRQQSGCKAGLVLWDRDFFFGLRTALKDRPQGPSTANHQPPSTANRHQPPTANRRQPPAATNRQPPTTANRHQPPIPNHQLPPTTINRHQPPSTANRQPPTANRQPPTHGVPVGIFGKPGYRNTSFFFLP